MHRPLFMLRLRSEIRSRHAMPSYSRAAVYTSSPFRTTGFQLHRARPRRLTSGHAELALSDPLQFMLVSRRAFSPLLHSPSPPSPLSSITLCPRAPSHQKGSPLPACLGCPTRRRPREPHFHALLLTSSFAVFSFRIQQRRTHDRIVSASPRKLQHSVFFPFSSRLAHCPTLYSFSLVRDWIFGQPLTHTFVV